MLSAIQNIDMSIFNAVNGRWISPFLDRLMVLTTNQETGILIVIGLLALFALLGRKKGRVAALSVLVAYGIIDPLGSYVIKPLIARPRPCHLGIGRLLVDCGSGFAMPSLHAAASFGIFTALVVHYGWRAAPLYIFAAGVAYSRVYVGVHWPSDVVVGALYGASIGFAMAYLSKKIFFKKGNIDAKTP